MTEFPEEENGSSIAMVKKNKSFMRICDQNERDVMKEMRSNRYEEHDDDDSFILFEHNPSEEGVCMTDLLYYLQSLCYCNDSFAFSGARF